MHLRPQIAVPFLRIGVLNLHAFWWWLLLGVSTGSLLTRSRRSELGIYGVWFLLGTHQSLSDKLRRNSRGRSKRRKGQWWWQQFPKPWTLRCHLTTLLLRGLCWGRNGTDTVHDASSVLVRRRCVSVNGHGSRCGHRGAGRDGGSCRGRRRRHELRGRRHGQHGGRLRGGREAHGRVQRQAQGSSRDPQGRWAQQAQGAVAQQRLGTVRRHHQHVIRRCRNPHGHLHWWHHQALGGQHA